MIISDNTRITVLQLAFDRLAVRVEVLLEAKDNFDEVFEGITFSNIPNLVPLTENYVADSEEATVKWKEIDIRHIDTNSVLPFSVLPLVSGSSSSFVRRNNSYLISSLASFP